MGKTKICPIARNLYLNYFKNSKKFKSIKTNFLKLFIQLSQMGSFAKHIICFNIFSNYISVKNPGLGIRYFDLVIFDLLIFSIFKKDQSFKKIDSERIDPVDL